MTTYDSRSLVGKYLLDGSIEEKPERKELEQAAVLQTCREFLRQEPRSLYALLLFAKNRLAQKITRARALLTALGQALQEAHNPDQVTLNLSALRQAQEHLKLLTISPSSTRLQEGVETGLTTFADSLAPITRRHGWGVIERTGEEARIDLQVALVALQSLGGEIETLFLQIAGAPSVWEQDDPGSTRGDVFSRTLEGLQLLQAKAAEGSLSPAVALLESQAIRATLSASGEKKDLATSLKDWTADSELVAPISWTSEGPWDFSGLLGSWELKFILGGKVTTIFLPFPSVSGHVYILGALLPGSILIPNPASLMVFLETTSGREEIPIFFEAGTYTLAALAAKFNSALGASGVFSSRLLIWRASEISLTINAWGGDPQLPERLGFRNGQSSLPLGELSPEDLVISVLGQWPAGSPQQVVAEQSGRKVRLSYTPDYGTPEWTLFGNTAQPLGLTSGASQTFYAEPQYLIPKNDGEEVLKAREVFEVGDEITFFGVELTVVRVEDANLFAEAIPLGQGGELAQRPVVEVRGKAFLEIVQRPQTLPTLFESLSRKAGAFLNSHSDSDSEEVEAAQDALAEALTLYDTELSTVLVPKSRWVDRANILLRYLLDRNFDRLVERLLQGDVAALLSGTTEEAAFDRYFLRAIADVAQTLLPLPTREEDLLEVPDIPLTAYEENARDDEAAPLDPRRAS